MKKIILFLLTALTVGNLNANVFQQNFGGSAEDLYTSVTAVEDGFIAVGNSDKVSFNNGDWEGIEMKGSTDPIIVKYDHEGNIVWKKNFNGIGFDGYPNTSLSYFLSVAAVEGGFVAAGYAQPNAFGSGDWTGVTGRGSFDAILVKFDLNGNAVWKKVFGGGQNGWDYFTAVTAVEGGIVAVGNSNPLSFNGGDLAGVAGKGMDDAVIVKFDNNGNILWKKNFGGSGPDYYMSVTATADGIVAAGRSEKSSFGTGDWTGVEGKGLWDAMLVKYDNNGNVLWKKSFGDSGINYYYSLAEVADGIVAAGFSSAVGAGDWEGVEGKGRQDAMLVKYDKDGSLVWKKVFGGSGSDTFNSVKATADGMIAVGFSASESFGTGDFANITGKGGNDAIVVKCDHDGNVILVKNFGGQADDSFNSVIKIDNEFVAVGKSAAASFGTGDFANIAGKGGQDAILLRQNDSFLSGIRETNLSEKNIVYPNPTTGVVYTADESVIKIYNASGAMMLETYGRQADLSDYPNGLYLLKVDGKAIKVIKE